MSLEERAPDPLGDLCGRFSGRIYGLKWITAAAVIAAAGCAIGSSADRIAAKLTDGEGNPRPYAVLGWTTAGCGGLLALLGLFRMSQAFEVRVGGVRYRSLLGLREMEWRDVDSIHVNKLTYVSRDRGRRSYYTVRIDSSEDRISLGSGFLSAVSALSLIQLLRMHGRRAAFFDGDDISVPARPRKKTPARAGEDRAGQPAPRKKRPRPRGTAAGRTAYDEAADRLAAGTPASEVEAWLRDQGMPPAVVRSMVDKALAEQIARDTARADADPVDAETEKLTRQARDQLRAGVKSEKVERWLREQGVSWEFAAAMVQNLREELL